MDIEIIEEEDNSAIQAGVSQNIDAINGGSTLFPVSGVWGIVQRLHSEDVSADIKATSGIEYRHIKVRSLAWVGADTTRAFGERDLPAVGVKVFVLFPDGLNVPSTAFALCSVVDTVWGMKKATDELAVSGKERIYKKITQAGWTIEYDKDTGDYSFISNDSPVIEIHAKDSDGSVSVKSGSSEFAIDASGNITVTKNGGEIKIDSNGVVSLSKAGAKIEITSTGAINVTPFAGQAVVLNGGIQNVNNLPACLFTGAPHGTNIGAKA